MPELVVRIKKNSDGSASLTCTRADGTATMELEFDRRSNARLAAETA